MEDEQRVYFYLKVATAETDNQVYDTLIMRFLDASGIPITEQDFMIANNTTPTAWDYYYYPFQGMSLFADQDIQIQFECVTNDSNDTLFGLDVVSLEWDCIPPTPTPTSTPTPTEIVYYIYLPVVVRMPTPTPTSTPKPSATPCPSHCSSDCSSHCSSDYCSSDYCSLDCSCIGWYCPSDCYSICGYYWP